MAKTCEENLLTGAIWASLGWKRLITATSLLYLTEKTSSRLITATSLLYLAEKTSSRLITATSLLSHSGGQKANELYPGVRT